MALCLTACQPVPQPFQPPPANKTGNPLLVLPDRAGVLVRRVKGLPGEGASALAREMADALVERNLPAFTEDGNASSLVLSGRAIVLPRAGGRTQIRLIWQLTERNGAQVGGHTLDIGALKRDWAESSPGLLREMAAKSAGKIAALIQEPAPTDRTQGRVERTLHVWKIDGAPDAAAALLRTELEIALRRRALRVSSGMLETSIVIVGTISLKPAGGEQRQLNLTWAVLAPDGRELGKLNQKNTVSPNALEADWPKIARSIALAAAEGIGNVLERVPESALFQPPSAKKTADDE